MSHTPIKSGEGAVLWGYSWENHIKSTTNSATIATEASKVEESPTVNVEKWTRKLADFQKNGFGPACSMQLPPS